LVLVHWIWPPSFALLRSVAVGCGLVTLAVNYVLVRWVWDRRAAMFSTLVLAVLPVDIIYSRLAWDSCLSVAATLLVLCVSLGAVQRPDRGPRLLTAAGALLAVAVLVHPTNLFIGAALVPAAFFVRRDVVDAWKAFWSRGKGRPLGPAWVAPLALVLLVAMLGLMASQPRVKKVVGARLQRVAQWTQPATLARSVQLALVHYPRLFVGGTVYRFTAGSGSAFEWPTSDDGTLPGADVVLFWGLLAGAAWLTWRSARTQGRADDMVLLVTWGLELVGFLAVAGVDAMRPHSERYALCLIAPAVLLLTRGAMLAAEKGRAVFAGGAVVAALAGWLLLADFEHSFFDYIRHTGGRSHRAFSTAECDPKQAALEYILTQREASEPTWIVTSEWWTYWPVRYLALGRPGVRVVRVGDTDADRGFQQSLSAGRVWLVELSEAENPAGTLSSRYKIVAHRVFRDYAGRPVTHAIRVMAAGSGF
jgi:hypothetical protein